MGSARKGPSALLQAARVHKENGFSRPSPGRIPPRSARSRSSRGASPTPAPEENDTDERTVETDPVAGPSRLPDPVSEPSKLPDPDAGLDHDQESQQERRTVEATGGNTSLVREVSDTLVSGQDGTIPDNTPVSTGIGVQPEDAVNIDSTKEPNATTSMISDEEAAIERRRRMMARITGEQVGPEGEAALRRSRSRQSTPIVMSRISPADQAPSQAQQNDEQPAAIVEDSTARASSERTNTRRPSPTTASMAEPEAEEGPLEPGDDGGADDVHGQDADRGLDARRPTPRQRQSAEGLFMRHSSSPAASPSVYDDSQADEASVAADEEVDEAQSKRPSKTKKSKAGKRSSEKASKKQPRPAEGDVDGEAGDGEDAQPKTKRNRTSKKAQTEVNAVHDGSQANGEVPAPRKKKRKSPATIAEGEETAIEAAEEASTAKRAKQQAKSDPDRIRLQEPTFEDIQNGGILEDEIDLNLLTMADLATKVTHGRVSERAGVLAVFHQQLKKQKSVRSVQRNWTRWERQQIIRRKLRALKNANREVRREESRLEGRNPDDDVSEDEADSEEEFEVIPDRLTPPEEEERVARIQPPEIDRPGEAVERGEEGEGNGEGQAGEEGVDQPGGGDADGEVNAERSLFFDPLAEDPEDAAADPNPMDEEDELAAFAHRDDNENEDEDENEPPRNEDGDIDWDAIQEENEEGGDWADSRDRLQEAIRRGEDTREVHEAQSATRLVNQNTFRRGKPAARWTHDETEFFYEVVSCPQGMFDRS